ncbi:s1 motif domain-containing protein [Trichonephila inaurata madagascariensis]|uniref:S1 motif domain-containing protein n=1 Tax=Trichonephila inaurata madagascariensis TaxID=2747483 RepID=A0A8X6X4R1_9ARAC|nr:s1 motif domain-containing protein [Trichonephila inaurata madagascariensis]
MDEEFSCIKQVKKTVQLPVPLSFVTNEITGISEILDSWKRQYVKSLHGIVVDYKNVSLTSRTGFIGINNPFIYYNVTATFDLFCPNIGDIVKGRINRISREHIGCLIQNTINVTIHLSRNSSTELSQFLSLEREILFEISHFDYERKMIRVTGQITPKCIQLMKDLFPPETSDDETGSKRENSNDSLFDPLTDSSLNQNNIEQSDVKSEVLPNNSLIKIKKSKKTKNGKRESESSILLEISSMGESSDEETKIKNKSMPNQSSNTHQYNSLDEYFSSMNSNVLESVKKEVSPIKEIQDKGHGKKRKRESSLSENKKKKKTRKDKVDKINGLTIDSSDNVHLTDVEKYIKEEVSSPVQPISTTQENESVTSTILSDKLKIEKKKKKHKDKKSGASKKNSSKKNKLKSKKSKVSASGNVLKKDKKSKKHKGSKSHKKIKSKEKKGKKTHSHKKKKPSAIKSKVS